MRKGHIDPPPLTKLHTFKYNWSDIFKISENLKNYNMFFFICPLYFLRYGDGNPGMGYIEDWNPRYYRPEEVQVPPFVQVKI